MADFGDLQKTLINQTAEIVNRDVTLTANHDKVNFMIENIFHECFVFSFITHNFTFL